VCSIFKTEISGKMQDTHLTQNSVFVKTGTRTETCCRGVGRACVGDSDEDSCSRPSPSTVPSTGKALKRKALGLMGFAN
jgi:hypothetical protein